jgi:hypothetical protein
MHAHGFVWDEHAGCWRSFNTKDTRFAQQMMLLDAAADVQGKANVPGVGRRTVHEASTIVYWLDADAVN